MKNPPLLSGVVIRGIISAFRSINADDLIPLFEEILKQNPVQVQTDSTPAMFEVSMDKEAACRVSDALAVIDFDSSLPSSFMGQASGDLVREWRSCASLL